MTPSHVGEEERRAGISAPLPLLPAHIEETIRSIARLHAEHHQNATQLQRAVDRVTALLGRPRFLGVLSAIAAAWISFNLLAAALGYRPIDPPPFSGLGSAVSLVSLYLVVVILTTQRREYKLAQLREQFTLELAILSEQKTGDPTVGRVPPGQPAHSRPGRSGSGGHGSACRPKIGARCD